MDNIGNAPLVVRAANPFGMEPAQSPENGALVTAQAREVAEVQAAVVMARKFPRDTRRAMDRILTDCTRPTLANCALYAYKRGSEIISGPSIRLAECIARAWGNVTFGIREISQDGGASQVEAYAWDLETNTRASKTFQVKHERKAQGSIKKLNDPRDVYELVANLGARRQRACILALIPGDVVEAAVAQCELTQTNDAGAPEEQVAKMLEKFAGLGITREMVAKRLGHKPEASKAPEIFNLRRIYQSLADGIGKADEFFEIGPKPAAADVSELGERIRARKIADGSTENAGDAGADTGADADA
jgi:hypothetical protein